MNRKRPEDEKTRSSAALTTAFSAQLFVYLLAYDFVLVFFSDQTCLLYVNAQRIPVLSRFRMVGLFAPGRFSIDTFQCFVPTMEDAEAFSRKQPPVIEDPRPDKSPAGQSVFR